MTLSSSLSVALVFVKVTEVGHDLDIDHDLDADAFHHADAGQDAANDIGHDAGGQGAGHGSGATAALSWLGVGRVPVSILLMVLLLSWGVVGFIANAAMERRGASAALVSMPLAALVSLWLTRLVVTGIVRYLPLYETTAQLIEEWRAGAHSRGH